MEEVTLFYIFVVVGIFASSCSQILLKKSAVSQHKNAIGTMLNWKVIIAYAIFGGALLINITAMSKGVKLKDLPILESLGYIFVPLLACFFVGETISSRTVISMILIIIGVIIFYI